MAWWIWIIIIIVIILIIWLIIYLVNKNKNPLGKKCSNDGQCGSTDGVQNHCSADPANPGNSYCQKTGINTGDPGATCNSPSPGCTGTSTCGADQTCSQLAKLKNGAACDPAQPSNCLSQICTPTGNSGICGTANGESCTTSGQCQSNNCSIPPGQSSGKCKIPSGPGSVCNNQADCTTGLTCSGGFCQTSGSVSGGAGYYCDPNTPNCTVEGYKCLSEGTSGLYTCQIASGKSNGSQCLKDGECLSGNCSSITPTFSFCQVRGTSSGTQGAYCPTGSTDASFGCNPDLYCSLPPPGQSNGTCKTLPTNGNGISGQVCINDSDCLSGACGTITPGGSIKYCGIAVGEKCIQTNNQCATGNCVCANDGNCVCQNGTTSGLNFYSTCTPNGIDKCKTDNVCTKLFPGSTTPNQCLYTPYPVTGLGPDANTFGPNACNGTSLTCANGFKCGPNGFCLGQVNVPTDSSGHCGNGTSSGATRTYGNMSFYDLNTKQWGYWGPTTGTIGRNIPGSSTPSTVDLQFTKIVASTSKTSIGRFIMWGLDPNNGLFFSYGPTTTGPATWQLAPPNASGVYASDTQGATASRQTADICVLNNYSCAGLHQVGCVKHGYKQTIADFSVDSQGVAWVAYNGLQGCYTGTANDSRYAPVFYYYIDLGLSDIVQIKDTDTTKGGTILNQKDTGFYNGLTKLISMDTIGLVNPKSNVPYMVMLGNNDASSNTYSPYTLFYNGNGYQITTSYGSASFNPVRLGTQIRFVQTPNNSQQADALMYSYNFLDKLNKPVTTGFAMPIQIPYSISPDGNTVVKENIGNSNGVVTSATDIPPNGYNNANNNVLTISDFCNVYSTSPFQGGITYTNPSYKTVINTTYMIASNPGGTYNLYYIPNLIADGITSTTPGFANILKANTAILPGYYDSTTRISADHRYIYIYSQQVCTGTV